MNLSEYWIALRNYIVNNELPGMGQEIVEAHGEAIKEILDWAGVQQYPATRAPESHYLVFKNGVAGIRDFEAIIRPSWSGKKFDDNTWGINLVIEDYDRALEIADEFEKEVRLRKSGGSYDVTIKHVYDEQIEDLFAQDGLLVPAANIGVTPDENDVLVGMIMESNYEGNFRLVLLDMINELIEARNNGLNRYYIILARTIMQGILVEKLNRDANLAFKKFEEKKYEYRNYKAQEEISWWDFPQLFLVADGLQYINYDSIRESCTLINRARNNFLHYNFNAQLSDYEALVPRAEEVLKQLLKNTH